MFPSSSVSGEHAEWIFCVRWDHQYVLMVKRISHYSTVPLRHAAAPVLSPTRQPVSYRRQRGQQGQAKGQEVFQRWQAEFEPNPAARKIQTKYWSRAAAEHHPDGGGRPRLQRRVVAQSGYRESASGAAGKGGGAAGAGLCPAPLYSHQALISTKWTIG